MRMKKFLLIILILFGVCFFLFLKLDKPLEIRVIANSNENKDITIRDEVIVLLKDDILPKEGLTKDYFSENEKIIEIELSKYYKDIHVNFTRYNYQNGTYINNDVLTLVISIGASLGEPYVLNVEKGVIDYGYSGINYKWFLERG